MTRSAIHDVHARLFAAEPAEVGRLIDSLASDDDRLWPCDRWPAMRFDRPLQVGASGGHGPVRYEITDYEPGRRVVFSFRPPTGLRGWHGLEAEGSPGRPGVVLRHVLEAEPLGWMRVRWPLVIGPLHRALVEDALDRALAATGGEPRAQWSRWVRFLRWAYGRAGRRR